jgi:penicillin-binding protein 1C
MADAQVIERFEVARASAARLSGKRHGLPALAPHLAEAAIRANPDTKRVELTIDRDIQASLELLPAMRPGGSGRNSRSR